LAKAGARKGAGTASQEARSHGFRFARGQVVA